MPADAPRQTVSLASISAPRPAFKSANYEGGQAPDEVCIFLTKFTNVQPYGFNAREHMRKQLIGQKVTFQIEYELGGRDYGWIKFNGVSLSHHVLRQGCAKLRNNLNPPQAHDLEILQAFQHDAMIQQIGIWNPHAQHFVREPFFIERAKEETHHFVLRNMHKRFPVVVEYIRDGGSFNVYVPHEEAYVSVHVTSVFVDGWRKKDGTEITEPFAEETKTYVDQLIFQRDGCVLRVEGEDDFGNIQGSLYTPKGSLSALLLGNGFARLNENTIKLTENAAELRAASMDAMNKQLRRWKDFVRNVAQTDDSIDYTTTVIEVVSGDVVIVKDPSNAGERRLYLSNVKAPRPGVARLARPDEPYAYEAREFLRKRLIGKAVEVHVDYTRIPTAGANNANLPPASDSKGRLHYVTLEVEGKNPVVELLKRGFARVNEVRRIEDDRGRDYDSYLEAEQQAAKSSSGVHSKKPYDAKASKLIDLSGPLNAGRAKAYERDFKDGSSFDAVVEHVANAGRYRLRVPNVGVIISCIVGGIRCPGAPNNAGQGGEPFGTEGLAFAREYLLQHEVSITVETVDKGGNFIATVRAPKVGDVAEALLRRGLARTSDFGAERPNLVDAEKEAKTKKLGVQTLVDEEAEIARRAAIVAASAEHENLDENLGEVTLTHAESVEDLFVNLCSRESEFNTVHSVCEEATALPTPSKGHQIGDTILAYEETEGAYFRASVIGRQPGDKFKVQYVDVGPIGIVHLSKTRSLPESISFETIAPLALKISLVGLKSAPTLTKEETVDAIYHRFEEIAGPNGKAYATVLRNLSGKNHVLIRASTALSAAESLNAALLKNGECFVDRVAAPKLNDIVLRAFNNANEIAKSSMLGVFQFGDIEEDEEQRRGGFGRRR